jgi:hypothetical protein
MRKRRLAAIVACALLAACQREPTAFAPPPDGRLTETQVRTYLKTEERRQKGQASKETQWIADRVREARMAKVASGLDQKIVDSRRKILRSLQERRRKVADPGEVRELDRQIVEVRKLLQGAPEEVPDSVRFNAELVARVEGR